MAFRLSAIPHFRALAAALVPAGILVILIPGLLRWIVGIYLIVIGLMRLFNWSF